MFDLENTNLKLLNCIFPPTVCAQSKYMNNLYLKLWIFFKANIIRKNLCKLCLSCFPLSTAENIWTKSELNLFWFFQSCLCLLTLPDRT